MSNFSNIKLNFAPGPHTRMEMMDGREYLVAPMVMLTVGVHNGSGGPVLYTEEELKKTPEVWNMKPLVVYHPVENGQGVSACSQAIIDSQGVGVIMNARWDGKLRAEAWFDIEKTGRIDDRITNALEKGAMMEISTGLFTDNEITNGTFEPTGEEYKIIARNYRPDHLAILPDQIGACSIADGGGLLQTNALSHSDSRRRLQSSVEERFGEASWVVDVFDNWVVFSTGGKLFRLTYTKENDMVVLGDGVAEAVIPQTVYRTVDGTLLGNSTVTPIFKNPEKTMKTKPAKTTVTNPTEPASVTNTTEPTKTKEENINSLIENKETSWEESHREFLGQQTDEFVANAMPAEAAPAPPTVPAAPAPAVVPTAPVPAATAEEYVNNAPPEVQGMLRRGLLAHNTERQQLIGVILANEQNVFTKEELEATDHDSLVKLSQLARKAPTANQQQAYQPSIPAVNYFGASGAAPAAVTNAGGDEDVLEMPSTF